MPSKKVLVFDISSEYGHFRKFNTTSSPLTYAIPTRPAIVGLLGAILGVEREIAPNIYRDGIIPVATLFDKKKSDIAVQILHPVKKVNIGFNLLKTKEPASFFNIKNRTQIEFELLKEPKFRVFVTHQDKTLFNNLCERIKKVNHYFTPYLGLAQFTATIHFKDLTDCVLKENNTDYILVHTAVSLKYLDAENPIDFQKGNAFVVADTLPIAMQKDRVVTEYAEVLVERKGQPLSVKVPHYYTTENYGNILFL